MLAELTQKAEKMRLIVSGWETHVTCRFTALTSVTIVANNTVTITIITVAATANTR